MKDSKIEWTNHTFNPWIGCARVSPGCENCYAEKDQDGRRGRAKWGVHGTRSVTTEKYWNELRKLNDEAKKLGIRYRIFVSSLADIFEDWKGQVRDHKQEPLEIYNGSSWVPMTLDFLRAKLFDLVLVYEFLDFQFLTKRIENVPTMVPSWWMEKGFPPNVWMGTSVEDQKRANERIPELLKIPARVRFLSCEPLLGPVEFSDVTGRKDFAAVLGKPALAGIHWIICGGESGHDSRPMHPDWARSLRNQCTAANVPFLFKQWGEWGPDESMEQLGVQFPVNMLKVGKKAAGRLLDGREWNQYPGGSNNE